MLGAGFRAWNVLELTMNCFVTGASGFIGANLVHELTARGHRVRALVRPQSDGRGLRGAEFERVTGDLGDAAVLASAMRGCDWCFHVAASYHLWLRDYAPMYAGNVEGTRRVIEAGAAAGCSRIVYTSPVGCIGLPGTGKGRLVGQASCLPEGLPAPGSGFAAKMPGAAGWKPAPLLTPTDETAPVSEAQMSNHYKRSKWRAVPSAGWLAGRRARAGGFQTLSPECARASKHSTTRP